VYVILKVPGLAVIIVGSRKDSQSYVNMKRKACAEVGIKSFGVDLPEEVSEEELIKKIHEFNSDPDVHGITLLLHVHVRLIYVAIVYSPSFS
jgi:5,10-methylene-tetrahydrofolate dehydrogenase/methenyl tetrahydrofolate cyclohydrolase